MILRSSLFYILLITAFVSCEHKKNITAGLYYWKTIADFQKEDSATLSSLQVKKLYIRFFDVDFKGKPFPVSPLQIKSSLPNAEIIPVIFIKNKVMESVSGKQIDSLALNISELIQKIAKPHQIVYKEIQIDCDWTLRTREAYFDLLKKIKKENPFVLLSCTIRLHQVKYPEKTGIPPIDKGMLMFYNMGNLQDSNLNSIYNKADANKYLNAVSKYSKPFDIALPVFGWIKQYRNGRVIDLINNLTEAELKNNVALRVTSVHHFAVENDLIIASRYFKKGDRLVTEEISPELAMEAAKNIKNKMVQDTFSVVLYHWKNPVLSNYTNEDIKNIYAVFN